VCTRSYIGLRIHARCRVCASAIGGRKTPLHEADGKGHLAAAAALLTHGADVNAKDDYGCGGPSLFRATVGVRRTCHCRPGRDRCTVVRRHRHDTQTIQSGTHTRMDVEVRMRRNTHTDARTKAHARTRAQQRAATHVRRRRPHALRRTHTHAHTHARTPENALAHTGVDGCMSCVCIGVSVYAYACACAHTCARAHADSNTSRSPTSARAHAHAGAVTHAGVRAHTQYSPMSVVVYVHARTHAPDSHTTRSPTNARTHAHSHAGAVTHAGLRAHTPAQQSSLRIGPHTRMCTHADTRTCKQHTR
jgi:hypothetical protein